MAYGITKESQIIDLDSINKGCNKLQEAAKKLMECGTKVANISEICDTNALSANGKSMVPVIQEDGNEIAIIGEQLSQYASNLQTAASSVYRSQRNEYATYLEEQKRKNSGD